MEFYNTVSTSDLNSDIAKFILENNELFTTKSLNYIGKNTCFSQPTLSRFFINTCSSSIEDYKKGDFSSINTADFLIEDKMSRITNREIIHDNLISAIDLILNIDESIFKYFLEALNNSNRILFIGHSPLQSLTYPLQTILIYDNKVAYAPQNYDVQEKLIKEFNEKDLIIIHRISQTWMKSNIMQSLLNILNNNSSKKILVSFEDDTMKDSISNTKKIYLDKNSFNFAEIQMLVFYKMASIKYAEFIHH